MDFTKLTQWQISIGSTSHQLHDPPKATPSKTKFKYEPLDCPSRDIRLFSLSPAESFTDDIRGSLFHASLDNPPVYEAISYVWGYPNSGRSIQLRYLSPRSTPKVGRCNEGSQPFPVTRNLENLLRHLRYSVVSRILWVDAICINQNENDERSEQVQLMASIYKLAVQSLVWLGEEKKADGEALQLIDRYSQKLSSEVKGYNNDPDLTSERWEAIIALFVTREIWMRIWILQEVVFSPRPILLCGRQQLPWTKLGRFVRGCEFLVPTSMPPAWQHAVLMDEYRERHNSHPSKQSLPSLLSLIRSTRSFKSTDGRDMLFALLNLASDRFGIVPDYNISPVEVWIAASKSLIRVSGTFDDILKEPLLVELRYQSTWSEILPSWIVASNRARHFATILPRIQDRHDAGVRHTINPRDIPSEKLNELVVEAIWLDNLTTEIYQAPTVHNILCFSRAYGIGSVNNEPKMVQVPDEFQPDIRTLLWSCAMQALVDSLKSGNDTSELDPRNSHNKPIFRDRRIDPKWITYCQERSREKPCGCLLIGENKSILESKSILRNQLLAQAVHGSSSNILGELEQYKLTITTRGFVSLIPPAAKDRDTICIVLGSPSALVLRPHPEVKRNYQVVGSAYVYGVSHGHAVHPDLRREDFFSVGLDETLAKRLYDQALKTWQGLEIKRPKRVTLF